MPVAISVSALVYYLLFVAGAVKAAANVLAES